MKSDLSDVHVVCLTKISHRRVDNVHLAHFASFDAVSFDQLTAIFQDGLVDGLDRFALHEERHRASSAIASKGVLSVVSGRHEQMTIY